MNVNTVYNEDCLCKEAGLFRLDAGSVGMVLTDPPYGIGFYSAWSKNDDYRKAVNTVDGIANDGKKNIDFLEAVATELFRVLKDNAHMYWFTRWDKIEEQKPMLERLGFKVKNVLIWVKNNWSMGDLKGAYAGQYECIIFCHKGRKTLNTVSGKSRHPDILSFNKVAPNHLLHSHQKPIDLLTFLIEKSSTVGDVVLDPFMGSFSTAVACVKTDRKFIGFEMDNAIYNRGLNRLEEVA